MSAFVALAGPPPPIHTNDDVVDAMNHIFKATRNGTLGDEASFTLEGNPQKYTIQSSQVDPNLGLHDHVTLTPQTFALFHVHPNNSFPEPSDDDKRIADSHNLQMYTVSQHGLYMYDPATKKTAQLARGFDWGKKRKK